MEEFFTINRMDIPPSLHRCLASTNLIEIPHSGVRLRIPAKLNALSEGKPNGIPG
jgi:hypothetical protein